MSFFKKKQTKVYTEIDKQLYSVSVNLLLDSMLSYGHTLESSLLVIQNVINLASNKGMEITEHSQGYSLMIDNNGKCEVKEL